MLKNDSKRCSSFWTEVLIKYIAAMRRLTGINGESVNPKQKYRAIQGCEIGLILSTSGHYANPAGV